jgi:hypothetical protein
MSYRGIDPEPLQHQEGQEAQEKYNCGHGSLGHYSQSEENSREYEVPQPDVPFLRIQVKNKQGDPKENEQIEPGVDNAGAEEEKRQDSRPVGQVPKEPETMAVDPAPEKIEHEQREDSADHIGKSGCKFIDPENLHGQDLKPEKKRRLFRKGFKIYLNVQVIATYDHFPGRFGIFGLICIEKMDRSQKGQKK